MASSYDSVWRNAPTSNWTPNGPAESGHNFMDQINEQKANVANAQNTYAEQKNIADASRKQYEDMFGNQTSYGDYYNQAKESEGVNQAREQYQKSLAAVNGVQSAMTALPSSINANSGRVLTQAQAQAAMANNMNEYNSTLNYWQNQNAGDLSQYQAALGAAQNLAGQQLSQQQQNINTSLSNYHTTMDELNTMYNQVLNERNILRTIYGDMYDDEYNRMAQQIEIWAKQVAAETARYQEAQASARDSAQRNWSEYMTNKTNADSREANATLNEAREIDAINQIYSNYIDELENLRNINGIDYFNPFLGLTGDAPSSRLMKAKQMENKGFEDYLYQKNPYLQKVLREDYSDLLGKYGIGA